MRHLPTCAVALVVVTGIAYASDRNSAAIPPIGTRIGDFSLPRAADGQKWSLAEYGRNARTVVVLFLGTECPVSNNYAPTLAALHRVYSPKGVVFVGVNSNQQDDTAEV